MSDNQFKATSLHDPKKNRTLVKIGEKKPVLDVELNEMQEIQNHMRAEIMRSMVHSGVLQALPINPSVYTSNDSTRNGLTMVPTSSSFASALNFFAVNPFEAVINGYKLPIDYKSANPGTSSSQWWNRVQLSEPPTRGSREDLVFLEAWFEDVDSVKDSSIIDSRLGVETNRRVELKWRIRTVAGVDFEKYPEGLGKPGEKASDFWNLGGNIHATPQAGNSEPLPVPSDYLTASHARQRFVPSSVRVATSMAEVKIALEDVGLYTAGDGTQASKDLLKTADGYVYAIPLFRVKRRNSGGYRADNVNGARDYYRKSIAEGNSLTITPNGTIQVVVDSTSEVKVGDRLDRIVKSSNAVLNNIFQVVSIDSATSMTIKNIYSADVGISSSYDLGLVSDRPEGKFANIIDKDDIIDLRHKVSLTGVNYQQLLEENFDKLLRGELNTKDKPSMKKERFGLTPAPLGMQAQLMPVKVKTADGTEKDLTNLAGDGSFDKGFGSVNVNSSGMSIDTTNSYNGGGSLKTGYIWNPVVLPKLRNSNYYMAIAYVKSNGTKRPRLNFGAGAGLNSYGEAKDSWHPIALKFQYDESTQSGSNLYLLMDGTEEGKNAWFDDLRVYEIDKTTYDLINVDAGYTGEELAKKFPYVSSYPNVVESVFDGVMEDGYYGTDGAPVASTGNSRSVNYTTVKASRKYYTNKPITRVLFYDSAKAVLSYATITGNEFTTPANCAFIRFHHEYTLTPKGSFITISESPLGINTPYGSWVLPYDYANGDTPNRFDIKQNRQGVSDAQVSETVADIIDPLSPHQRHIKVTQATPGTWAIGDKITITSEEGIISGVLDSDTALATVVKQSTNSNTLYLDDVSKFAVNDTFAYYKSDGKLQYQPYTITAIDTVEKSITFSGTAFTSEIGHFIVENTASTSVPSVGMRTNTDTVMGFTSGITWTGLGTKEAIGTIATAPNSATVNGEMSITYSVSYPAGKGIKEVPSEVLETRMNRLKYVKSDVPKLKMDFRNKVSGSTVENPHIFKRTNTNNGTTLLAPSSASLTEDSLYSELGKLDGTLRTSGRAGAGHMEQHLFSFDLIAEVERQYGRIPKLTVAEKVQWLKDNVSRFVAWWHGFGSSPTGNKATLNVWETSLSSWSATTVSHTNSTVSMLAYSTANMSRIDSNGMLHFLAYADASDGTTASTINTDYVELEIELKSQAETGYDVFVPEEPFNILVDAPQMFNEGENMIPPFTDARWVIHANAKVISSYQLELNATAQFQTSYIDIIVAGNTQYTLKSLPFGNVTIKSKDSNGNDLQTHFDNSASNDVTFTTHANAAKLRVGFYNSSETGQFTFTNPMLTLGSKVKPFVPYSKNVKRKRKMDFLGKVAGSTFENPHKAYRAANASIQVPSSFSLEDIQANYNDLMKIDGAMRFYNTPSTGAYAQLLYEFDLSHLGLSLSELKKALKKMTIRYTGYGKGDNAGAIGYGASGKIWNEDTKSWTDTAFGNTANAPTSGFSNPAGPFSRWISKDQKVYVIVHPTYPAGAASPSEIYTDYISLEVESADWVDAVPKNVVKVRKETKEVKTVFPMNRHSSGERGSLELFYKAIPYQGFAGITDKFKHLTAMDKVFASAYTTRSIRKPWANFLIPFTEILPIANKAETIQIPILIEGLDNGLADVFRDIRTIGKSHVSSSAYMAVQAGYENSMTASAVFNLQKNYRYVIEKDIVHNAHIIAIGLVSLNDKILMIVYGGIKRYKDSISGDNPSTEVIHLFDIQGKPLVKGV